MDRRQPYRMRPVSDASVSSVENPASADAQQEAKNPASADAQQEAKNPAFANAQQEEERWIGKILLGFLRWVRDIIWGNNPRVGVVIALIISLLGGGSGVYAFYTNTHNPQVSAPTSSVPLRLGAVDINEYCRSLGYSEYDGLSGNWCFSYIDLNNACSVLNGMSNLHFRLSDSQDLYTGFCYNSQEMQVGGSVALGSYCKEMRHKGSIPEEGILNQKWVCLVKADMTVACEWEYNQHNLQARKDDQDQWACYGS